MQHTTKMVMVPEDAYTSLVGQQQQLMPPVAMQLSNLDNELKSILNNPSLGVDEKYNSYYRTFNRYSHLQGKPTVLLPEPPREHKQVEQKPEMVDNMTSTVVVGVPVSEKGLLDNLPKIARRRGKLLLEHLKRKEQIQWADTGELLVNDRPVEGSNVTDLFHFFTRDRPSVVPPKGAREFAELLQETNVPVEAVVPDSFNKAGTLTFDLGTLFSPNRSPKKTPRKKTTERKPKPTLGKRKTTRPVRYASIKWEEL